MKKGFVLISIGLFLSISVSALNRFVEKSFFSQALNSDKTYFVSCPDGYNESDTTKKYPVIIFLHGASVNAKDVVEQFDSIVSLSFAKILFPNFFKVIFCIADGSAPPYLGSFYSNSELYGNFESYIATDFYKEIHQKYNTYNHREKWSLLGHSMGGYGSMKIALKYPNQFIGIASLSGPLHTTYYNDILPLLLKEHGNTPPYDFPYQGDVTKLIYSMAGAFSPDTSKNPPIDFPILSDGTVNQDIMPRWEAENPINFIRKWNGNPKMAIFTYCGELDEYKLLSQNQIFSDTLTAHNITHTFKIDPYGDHTNSLLTSFPMGLNFLYGVMDTAQIRSTPNSVNTILKQKFYIFPNPAKDRLNFSTTENSGIENVSIISIMGARLKTFSNQNLKNGLDISALKPGYYLLSITFHNGQKEKYNFIKAN